MTESNIIRLADRTNITGGLIWNRLHSERETLCEALVQESIPDLAVTGWHHESDGKGQQRELLQGRLRKVDDALDRLMSGSYGNCCKCGRWIQETKLALDPAIAFCIHCWEEQGGEQEVESTRQKAQSGKQQTEKHNSTNTFAAPARTSNHSRQADTSGLSLNTLNRFDTVSVKTRNSDYRVFFLDPREGRGLIEGGSYFVEPTEAMLIGAASSSSEVKPGFIGVGLRLDMWVDGRFLSTSPVESVSIVHDSMEPESVCVN